MIGKGVACIEKGGADRESLITCVPSIGSCMEGKKYRISTLKARFIFTGVEFELQNDNRYY